MYRPLTCLTAVVFLGCGGTQAADPDPLVAPAEVSTAPEPFAVELPAPDGRQQLAAGHSATCVIGADRIPRCFGVIDGMTEDENRPQPTALASLGVVDSLALRGDAGCAITDARLRCFSGGTPMLSEAELDAMTDPLPEIVEVASDVMRVDIAVYYTCFVRTNHTAACFRTGVAEGRGEREADVEFGVREADTDVVQFAADIDIRCKIGTDGVLQCIGSGAGIPEEGDSWATVPGIAAATSLVLMESDVCVLQTDKQVVCFSHTEYVEGNNDTAYYAANQWTVPGLRATALVGADQHACAISDDGRVLCWGANDEGQLGVAEEDRGDDPVHVAQLDGASEIALGYDHTCALVAGRLRCLGGEEEGTFPPSARVETSGPR